MTPGEIIQSYVDGEIHTCDLYRWIQENLGVDKSAAQQLAIDMYAAYLIGYNSITAE